MEFNVTKCNILQLSTHHNISQFNYTVQGVQLITVKQHHYLGILLDQKLFWHPHIEKICDKANCLLRDPYHHNATNQIEIIQHCATHFVLNRSWYKYHLDMHSMTRMLTELQWPTLQTLRSEVEESSQIRWG